MPDLNFSFCIVTDNSLEACKRIGEIVKSVRKLEIPRYEILIIGGQGNKFAGNTEDIIKIDFDESKKPGWITKKKNIVAAHAKYENLVILHDYFVFHKNWYKGYTKIFNNFEACDICCNPIFLEDGRREYTDWVTWDHPEYGKHASLNYNDLSNTKYQYISGGYFLVKKKFFIDNPLNEDLIANQGEDVEWSIRVRDGAKIHFNPFSYVKHNKEHRNQKVDTFQRLI